MIDPLYIALLTIYSIMKSVQNNARKRLPYLHYFTAHKTSTKHSVSSVSEQSRGQSLNLSQHRHNSEFLNYKISIKFLKTVKI